MSPEAWLFTLLGVLVIALIGVFVWGWKALEDIEDTGGGIGPANTALTIATIAAVI